MLWVLRQPKIHTPVLDSRSEIGRFNRHYAASFPTMPMSDFFHGPFSFIHALGTLSLLVTLPQILYFKKYSCLRNHAPRAAGVMRQTARVLVTYQGHEMAQTNSRKISSSILIPDLAWDAPGTIPSFIGRF
jgi:hypothetical protein